MKNLGKTIKSKSEQLAKLLAVIYLAFIQELEAYSKGVFVEFYKFLGSGDSLPMCLLKCVIQIRKLKIPSRVDPFWKDS